MGEKKEDQDIRKRAVVAILNQYKQLENLDVLGTQDAKIMYCQEKYRELRAVNPILKNRCGKIKGRTCIYRSRQRNHIPEK